MTFSTIQHQHHLCNTLPANAELAHPAMPCLEVFPVLCRPDDVAQHGNQPRPPWYGRDALLPDFSSDDSLVFALYDRNTRMLVFLVAIISMNLLNNAFWTSVVIRNTTSYGPCIAENPPFTAVYLA